MSDKLNATTLSPYYSYCLYIPVSLPAYQFSYGKNKKTKMHNRALTLQ